MSFVIPFGITSCPSHELHFASVILLILSMLHVHSLRLVGPKFCKGTIECVFVPEIISLQYFITPVIFVYFEILLVVST
jgi:hypothetical protein